MFGLDDMNLPACSTSGYSQEDYEEQKRNGKRLKNGTLKLKKLKRNHFEMIALHLQGRSNNQIATLMNVSHMSVSRVLNDPLAQEVIQRAYGDYEMEFDGLMGQFVQTLRQGFDSDDIKDRIKTGTLYQKAREDKIRRSHDGGESAEDVIQRMLNLQINVNVGDT